MVIAMNTFIIGWAVAHFFAGPGPVELEPIRWLSGCWQSRDGGVTEVWSPPVDGVMVGIGLTSVAGRAPSFEHLRIQADPGGGIVYVARPSGQNETAFHSTRVDESGFLVENPAHDFPTRIQYTVQDRGGFTAQVTGPSEGGRVRGFELVFERIDCEARG